MPLYLDSAIPSDAEAAAKLGWVAGVTTNPTLLARSPLPPEETLQALARALPGPIFYQLTAPDADGMLAEAERAAALLQERLVLKIPATAAGFETASRAAGRPKLSQARRAITAIYTPAQMLTACAVDADFALVYHHRILDLPDGVLLIDGMTEVLKGCRTQAMAASIKSPEEAVAAWRAGFRHLTIPLGVLQALTDSKLSRKAVADFKQNGIGL